jgi:hypothetical protein
MPNDTILDGVPRGTIELRNVDTTSMANINLGETGAVNYTLELFAGTYDVLVQSYSATSQSVLPDTTQARIEKGCSP